MRLAQRFLVALVLGWATCFPISSVTRAETPAEPSTEEVEVLEQFVENYFDAWSRVDFEAYDDCFHPNAMISLLGEQGGGLRALWTRADFVASQKSIQEKKGLEERPIETRVIGFYGDTAVVEASWVLYRPDDEDSHGIDIFHLARESESQPWKIVYLTFWTDSDLAPTEAPDQAEQAGKSRPRVVVSGFGPFGGRDENASSIFAEAIVDAFPEDEFSLEIVPVIWGAPAKVLAAQSELPDLWIAFGEGPEFRVESIADNFRAGIPDVLGNAPQTRSIVKDGEARYRTQFPVTELADSLAQDGYPIQVSREAGNYLCEEMLYVLSDASAQQEDFQSLFVHIPILGKEIEIAGQRVAFSDEVLEEAATHFAKRILDLSGIYQLTPDQP
ncbi:MAG: nuclear transport factor 2 family protein [Verrucomicrobiota bacterium]